MAELRTDRDALSTPCEKDSRAFLPGGDGQEASTRIPSRHPPFPHPRPRPDRRWKRVTALPAGFGWMRSSPASTAAAHQTAGEPPAAVRASPRTLQAELGDQNSGGASRPAEHALTLLSPKTQLPSSPDMLAYLPSPPRYSLAVSSPSLPSPPASRHRRLQSFNLSTASRLRTLHHGRLRADRKAPAVHAGKAGRLKPHSGRARDGRTPDS